MVQICFYFQVHQPYRLKKFGIFDLGKNKEYFDEKKNKEVMQKVANKCYLPMNNLLLKLIKKYNGKFKVSFSISGMALEQFEQYAPEVLDSFKQLARTGCVDFLSETYYHSLSFLYSKEEFREQVKLHQKKIKELFGVKPVVFRNTELVFSNEIAKEVEKMGFKAVLAEGAEKILGWRSSNFVYNAKDTKLKLLLKNYKLSDDIAFRFSNKGWKEYPLTAPKFSQWVHATNGNGELINLFMDYETFGEHQWEDTGIFNFVEQLPEEIFKHPDGGFVSINEAIKLPARDEVDFPYCVSWADTERDLTAWLGNEIQQTSKKELYELEKFIKKTKDPELIEHWRKLTTSDHFYYMCTKWFNDGDVHKYFSPYDSPYECFISFMNILNDMVIRVNSLQSNSINSINNLNNLNKNETNLKVNKEENFIPSDNPSLFLAQNAQNSFK